VLYSISVGRATIDGIQGVFRDLLLRTVNRRGAVLFTLRTLAPNPQYGQRYPLLSREGLG
jgi:hypothetical protein